MTTRLYYDSSARVGSATIAAVASDDHGPYVVLDATLFHPQGGGQPADRGTIEDVPVTHVASIDDEIRHYVASTDRLAEDLPVTLRIDDAIRTLHERLHTAGHLIAAVTELLFPQADPVAGHHWPGEARVDFQWSVDTLDADAIRFILEPELRRAIARNPKVYAAESTPAARMVVIDGYRPMRCGGTHLTAVADIGELTLRAVAIKRGRLRIGYDIA